MFHAKYVHKYKYYKTENWTETNQNATPKTRTINDNNEYTNIAGNTPVYDTNGNQCSLGFQPENQQYIYEWANRLIEIKDADSATITTYTYDLANRRVTKTNANIAIFANDELAC